MTTLEGVRNGQEEFAARAADNEPHEEGSERLLQRSIFPWVTAEDEMMGTAMRHMETTTLSEVATMYGVPETIFQTFIAKEIHEAESCYGLPFTLLIVVSYAGMMICHHGAVTVFSVENALIESVEKQARFGFEHPWEWVGFKNLHDVHSHVDFWSFMHQGLCPLFLQQVEAPWETSEGWNTTFLPDEFTTSTPRPDLFPSSLGILKLYNRIVGGIRLSQERFEERIKCPSSDLKYTYGKSCVGGIDYELDPDPFSGRRTEKDPSKTEWLWDHDNSSVTLHRLRELERDNWLDEHTQKVEVAIGTYNGEHNLHTFLTVNFYFSRTGKVWKRIIPSSVFAEQFPIGEPIYYVFDVTYITCLGIILLSEAREIHMTTRRLGYGRAFIKAYVSFWNSIDLLSVLYGVAIIILAAAITGKIYWLNLSIAEMADFHPVWFSGEQDKYRDKAKESVDYLEHIVFFTNRVRIVFACHPFVIVLRLLKAFAAQPRLAIVTRTLYAAGQDLFHFTIVFMSVLSSFIVCAMVLFGPYVDEFATVSRAVTAVFRVAMGDFDWDKMRIVGEGQAAVWLFSFIIIMVLMMLNILLAIVMSAYYEVAANVASADNLFQEIGQAYERWIGARRGELVPLIEVAHSVKVNRHEMRVLFEADENCNKVMELRLRPLLDNDRKLRLVTVEFLRLSVLKIRSQQARELLESAVDYYRDTSRRDTQTENMLHLMTEMSRDVRNLHTEVNAFVEHTDSEDSDKDFDKPKKAIDDEIVKQQQSLFEHKRRLHFENQIQNWHIELRHARLWVGTDTLGHEREYVGHGEEARPKTSSLDRDKYLHTTIEDLEKDPVALASWWNDSKKFEDREAEEQQDLTKDLEELTRVVDAQTAVVDQKLGRKFELESRTKQIMQEIEELEPELLKMTEATAEVGSRFHRLRQHVAMLIEDRRRFRDEGQGLKHEVKTAHMSRTECFELVHSLANENDALRHQLVKLKADRESSNTNMSRGHNALQKAQALYEPKLEEARQLAPQALEVKGRCYTELLALAHHAELAPGASDCPELIELLKDVRALGAAAKTASDMAVSRNARSSTHAHDLVPPDYATYSKMLLENGNTLSAI